jgi:hypothetical protein
MPGEPRRPIQPYSGGFFSDISNHLKLVVRLLLDRRVNPLIKLIPIATMAYLFIPDLILGPFDDAAVIGLGIFVFVELCPPEVVEEHRAALARTIPGEWRDPQQTEDNEIVDAKFKDEE